MPVQMMCPNLRCRKILSVPDEARGKQVRCQYCDTTLRVPDGRKAPVAPVAAAAAAAPAPAAAAAAGHK